MSAAEILPIAGNGWSARVPRKMVSAAVKRAKGASERRGTLPILSAIRVSTSGGHVVFEATDLEVAVRTQVVCDYMGGHGEVACVDAALLAKAIGSSKSSHVDVAVSSDGAVCVDGITLPLLPAEEYPTLAWTPYGREVALELDQTWTSACTALSKDFTRVNLSGALLDPIQGFTDRAQIVCTDGHRMHFAPVRILAGELAAPVWLPELGRVCAWLARGTVRLHVEPEVCAWLADEHGTRVRLKLDAIKVKDFPNYRQVIPHAAVNRVALRNIDPAELVATLRALQVVSSDRTGGIKLTVPDGAPITLEASNPDGARVQRTLRANAHQFGELVGQGFDVRVDPAYLAAALEHVGPGPVWLRLDPQRQKRGWEVWGPITLGSELTPERMALIMPMRL